MKREGSDDCKESVEELALKDFCNCLLTCSTVDCQNGKN
jgi:hypothetical protein